MGIRPNRFNKPQENQETSLKKKNWFHFILLHSFLRGITLEQNNEHENS